MVSVGMVNDRLPPMVFVLLLSRIRGFSPRCERNSFETISGISQIFVEGRTVL
jgi:hypothetical protein